ncbi:MAG: HEAT repeat domain-containing protein [Planctomycetes bacterium]|nr:HEAT repeat domain-containing protein [Planctomycetota bacterium]
MRKLRILARVAFVFLVSAVSYAADPKDAKKDPPYTPLVKPASKEGEAALKRFQLDKSLKMELWAAEPMLANPVCFCFDEKGKCYVAETFRHSAGATDNRGKPWLDDDLASRTVEDRVAMFSKYAKKNFTRDYEFEHDRVRLLEDTTGSGKADKSTIFRDDFGKAADGIGAGLLARNGDVYFTNIPSLYKLKDTKGTGEANVKETLSTGYGVHVAFIGHDLHGLRMGPDGKLYFSIGDRGFNVKTKEGKHLFYPDTGAVLRCELDGSNLEVVHTGLRNPQELAFDDFGNLFTVDNNSDSGDKARFVYIVEGGDSGWRIGYQYGSSMHDASVKQGNRGPWNYEKLWHPQHDGQPAYIVPPLINFSDGPSGFTHYPGIGLSDKYKGHFFLCDFRGNAPGSGIWSFTTKPKGASFELVNPQKFVWSVLATDCDFGPDCNFYISDWTDGWAKPGKGRMYKVSDPEAQRSDSVIEAKKLMAEGFSKRPIPELIKLLEHPHQTVRQESQFALVAKGKTAVEPLTKVAKENKNLLARIHAIWGLGMLLKSESTVSASLIEQLKDQEPEVRAQAAKVLGATPSLDVIKALIQLLNDPESRVVFFALQSLGKSPPSQDSASHQIYSQGMTEVIKQARTSADKDPYLRHALARAMSALSGFSKFEERQDSSPVVRMTALLAWRHKELESPGSAKNLGKENSEVFLADTDPNIVTEAARVIHDVPVLAGLSELAKLVTKKGIPDAAMYRALNANYRLGKPENAEALAAFAANTDAPPHLRTLALEMLGDWASPPRRDFITGLTQNLPPRDTSVVASALKTKISGIFSGPPNLQTEAATLVGELGLTEVGPVLRAMVSDANAQSGTRIVALNALKVLKDDKLATAVKDAIASTDPKLRNAGRGVLITTKPDEVIKQLKQVLTKNDIVESQGALALLASVKTPEVDEVIEGWLERLMKDDTPAELHLDILEAAAKRPSTRLKRLLKTYEDARPKTDPLAAWSETLKGGDAALGRDIFLNKAAVQCQRCHKLDGQGGEVGPPLNGLAAKQKRDYLLESLVLPNKQIAKGYESILIEKTDGKTVSGVLKSEDAKEVKLMTAEGQLLTIPKSEIEDRRATKTAMPEDVVQKLSKREIRDLVEFLAELKEEWKK